MTHPFAAAVNAALPALIAADESLMQDTCQIVRRQDGARNEFGQKTETWTVAATAKCRIATIPNRGAGNEQGVAGVLTSSPVFELSLPLGTTVLDSDRIVHVQTGNEYEVKDAGQANTIDTSLKVAIVQLGRA